MRIRINWGRVLEKAATVLSERDRARGEESLALRIVRAVGGGESAVGTQVALSSETVEVFGQKWEARTVAVRKG